MPLPLRGRHLVIDLDLVVVAVGALLFFQLQESGSLVTEDLFGGLQQDPLLLIAPAVFVVTVAVLFLRLFPLLLSAFGGVARLLGGASTQMVLWHLTRAPVQPGRLALLLSMATALGMFGGTLTVFQTGFPIQPANGQKQKNGQA